MYQQDSFSDRKNHKIGWVGGMVDTLNCLKMLNNLLQWKMMNMLYGFQIVMNVKMVLNRSYFKPTKIKKILKMDLNWLTRILID